MNLAAIFHLILNLNLLISVILLTFFNEPHLKIPVLTVFLAFDQATTLKMHFGPHNYIHGWKAVYDEQIFAPRFGGLEPVTKAFFNMLGSKCLSSDGASPRDSQGTNI